VDRPRDARLDKQRLRQSFRSARRAFTADSTARAAESLAAHAEESPLLEARSVAGYVATDGELDVLPLLERLRPQGARILLPRRRSDGTLDLVAFDRDSVLRPTGAGGVPEPLGTAMPLATASRPAVLLAPSVALDHRGGRLGRGGGAYDRLIPELRALGWCILGVCHASQVVDVLPSEPHDQTVDGVLSEEGIRWVRPPGACGAGS
jgi:5-formyltetrahydrofolate cyclo-ligase